MMRHLSCCALLVTMAVGCDFDDAPNNNDPDGGIDAGSDAGSDAGAADSGSDASPNSGGGTGGNPTTTGGRGGNGGIGGTGGAGSTAGGGTGAVGGSDTGGAGESGSGGEGVAGEGGGESPDDAGTDPEPTEPELLELVSFTGIVTQAPVGQTIRGAVQWRNASSQPIYVIRALITARAPGASPSGGPYDDFNPSTDMVTVAPGDTLSITGSILPREVLGEWSVYPTYADVDGIYRDYPATKFSLVTDPEYGSFENTIWPVADPSDSPNEDRRFAIACYKRLTTGDSARCTARYGLGTLPYQVSPDRLTMLQDECVTEGGVLLSHACPTNQMLQLCWEDTRSPAYAYSCEYYGDPNNKSPQFPGAAPDIIFYNDNYLGRNPQP